MYAQQIATRAETRYALHPDQLARLKDRTGFQTVGAHADQLTYLGPYPTIASLSLGVTRNFRLRGVPSLQSLNEPPPRTYDIQLPHNSLCIMGASCQERFKHGIPPARSIDLFKIKHPDGTVTTHIERINVSRQGLAWSVS